VTRRTIATLCTACGKLDPLPGRAHCKYCARQQRESRAQQRVGEAQRRDRNAVASNPYRVPSASSRARLASLRKSVEARMIREAKARVHGA
jgi:hypothetical protein